MKILLTNDDGYEAAGLRTLARAMRRLGDVVVVAPSSERSAVSHALTISEPLLVEKKTLDGIPVFAVGGTPADCVKLALKKLLSFSPDIVVSGINHGSNTGVNVFYSGTVAAALEAALSNTPAFAVSYDSFHPESLDFSAAFSVDFARFVLDDPLPENMFFNVNIPRCLPEDIKGVRLTYQGKERFADGYREARSCDGKKVYYLDGEDFTWSGDLNEDNYALHAKWISVSVLQASFNIGGDTELLKDLSEKLERFWKTRDRDPEGIREAWKER